MAKYRRRLLLQLPHIADRLIAAAVPRDRIHVKSTGSKEPPVTLETRLVVEVCNRPVEILP